MRLTPSGSMQSGDLTGTFIGPSRFLMLCAFAPSLEQALSLSRYRSLYTLSRYDM